MVDTMSTMPPRDQVELNQQQDMQPKRRGRPPGKASKSTAPATKSSSAFFCGSGLEDGQWCPDNGPDQMYVGAEDSAKRGAKKKKPAADNKR